MLIKKKKDVFVNYKVTTHQTYHYYYCYYY